MDEQTVEDLRVIIAALNQRTADYDVQILDLRSQIELLTHQVAATSDRDQWKAQCELAMAENARLKTAMLNLVSGTDGGKAALEELKREQLLAMKAHAAKQLEAMSKPEVAE